jgi:AraC family transcriptional regulator
MNAAIDYIEESLEDEIDYNKAAKIACCSLYTFSENFLLCGGHGTE